jgi:two-component system CheB/CheR fusion protein
MKSPVRPGLRPKQPAPRGRPTGAAGKTAAEFPIVGLGASAGGLEALEQFFRQVSANSGLAFVVVQHLDPTHKGILPELLQRGTGLKVVQVRDRTPVRPDCIYVIPPNKDMSILHGVLHLLVPTAPRGLRLPIDFFFRSLALDQRERSVGVILSGMGADGTQGLRAIKEQAGVALVQEPATAKFDGMPRSAIDAGLADIVAAAEDLPGKLGAYLRQKPLLARPEAALDGKALGALEKIVILLRAHTGHDFSAYKRNTLCRRIERRMGIHQLGDLAGYVRYLGENSQELDLLFRELLIGVTNFFRDPATWEQLRTETLPGLLAGRPPGQTLRAWVAGCSTGEEAYSLAMVFREAVELAKLPGSVALQIFATDLDRDAIEKARQGFFPENLGADVSPARLKRFFVREDHGYRVRKEIREMITFAPQNLVMDPPFTKLDFLSCRNLLIYLTPEVQQKLMPLFHYSLLPGGILLLGSAETVGNGSALFAPARGKSRIFRRLEPVGAPARVEFPSAFGGHARPGAEVRLAVAPPASLQALADQLVLQRFAPAAVLVNDRGDLLYVSGRTGKYLEPAAGKANWNLFVMARESLRYELSAAFQQALRQAEPVTVRGLRAGEDESPRAVDVTVVRLTDAGPLNGLVLLVFTEVPGPVAARPAGPPPKAGPRQARLTKLEQELLQVRLEARASHEEMQTAQEEFRSANEELQSTNEELQSANEELTTSKEEMQSLNEELQTVNAELQAKLQELSLASDDMKNLLDSTDIATLFLDKDLHVRRFTPQATRIIKLIPGDAGRPITDLASQLNYPDLADDARRVLRRQVPEEKPIDAKDGRWFSVRIMPYRTLDDRIDGVVITFADITAAKKLEASLRGAQAPAGRPRPAAAPKPPSSAARTKTVGARTARRPRTP